MSDKHHHVSADLTNANGVPMEFRLGRASAAGDDSPPTRLLFTCCRAKPDSVRQFCSVTINGEKNHNGAGWGWDGNLERPTITPSIRCLYGPEKTRCHMHLTGGQFVLCDDHPPTDPIESLD